MNPNNLTVYESIFKKIRLGNDFDGGYVIAEINKDDNPYKLLISCGIGKDISFEKHFTDKYNIKCYAFDGTIQQLPNESNSEIIFVNKNISKENSNTNTNMLDIINENDNIFLKMDIETWEYDWLSIINDDILNKFKQIVIEFHFPFTYSEDIFNSFSYPMDVEYKMKCLAKIAETHYLVHFHCNNCCGTTNYENIVVPNVFECTYVRKNLVSSIELNNTKIPDPILDRPNVKGNPDIELSGYPFTHTSTTPPSLTKNWKLDIPL